MFGKRKKAAQESGNSCPYCEYVNPEGAETCAQCYYVLAASAREQPMATPTTSGADLMSTLLSDEMEDAGEEGYAIEAVLQMEDEFVDVEQYEIVSQEEDTFQYIEGSRPTVSETVGYQKPEEVELSTSDAPTNPVHFEIEDIDPLEEVPEPVHTGMGGLYSPMIKQERDDDLTGSVGPNNGASATPDLPDFDDDIPKGGLASAISGATQSAAVAQTAVQAAPVAATPPAATPDLPGDESQEASATPDLPDDEEAGQAQATPEPQHNNRIWPWPAQEPWNANQVYREVVSALEKVKAGKLHEAAEILDNLGPHLTENLDMLLHIGVIMKHIGRQEHLNCTLAMAARVYPGNEQVSSAIAQL